jgi:hypothetical protein
MRVFGEIPTGSKRKGAGGRRGLVGEGGVAEEEVHTLSRTLSFELSSAENIFTYEKVKGEQEIQYLNVVKDHCQIASGRRHLVGS